MDIRGQREVTLPMIVAVGGMGERRGGQWWWIGGGERGRAVCCERKQAGWAMMGDRN